MWWLGAIFSIMAKSLTTFGVNCHKLSAMKEAERVSKRSYWNQPIWAGGLAMLILGALGDFAALALTAQSVVAPIGASSLVVNIFFAHYWLKEELHNTDVYGCLLIVAGSVTAVLFGSRSELELSVKDLLKYFCRAPFVIYMVLTGMVALACKIALKKIEVYHEVVEKVISEAKESPGSTQTALEQLKNNPRFLEAKALYDPYQKFHPMFYCILSGALGGQSLLFAKCVAELMKTTFRGDNQLANPIFYLFLGFMFFFVLSQVHFLNKALILCDALLVVPVFQCTFLSFSTLGGLIYYQEYLEFRILNWLGLFFGLFLILSGVYTLCFRSFSSFEVEVVDSPGEQDPDAVPSDSPDPPDHMDIKERPPQPDAAVVLPPAESRDAPPVSPRRSATYRLGVKPEHKRNGSNIIPVGDPFFIPTLSYQGTFSDIMHYWPNDNKENKKNGKTDNHEPGSIPGDDGLHLVPGVSNSHQMKLYE